MRAIDFYTSRDPTEMGSPNPELRTSSALGTELNCSFFRPPPMCCRTSGWHCSRSSEAMLFLAIAYKFSCGRRSTGNEWDFGLS